MQGLSKSRHDGARGMVYVYRRNQLVTSLGMRFQGPGCYPVRLCTGTRLRNESQGIVAELPGASQETGVNVCAKLTWMET